MHLLQAGELASSEQKKKLESQQDSNGQKNK